MTFSRQFYATVSALLQHLKIPFQREARPHNLRSGDALNSGLIESKGVWTPPFVTALPVMATAAGNLRDPDFSLPNLLPPRLMPRPHSADHRSEMSRVSPSVSAGSEAVAMSNRERRIWTPPAVIALPLSAATRGH